MRAKRITFNLALEPDSSGMMLTIGKSTDCYVVTKIGGGSAPSPVVAPADAVDMRGLWQGVDGAHVGHVERIEQCGARVVVTSSGLIHDSGPNSTGGLTTNDTEGAVLFMLGDREYCPRTAAEMVWNQGVLDFHVFGWGPVVVRRYLENDQLVWEYVDGTTTRMNRICRLPDDQKVPAPRGPRIKLS